MGGEDIFQEGSAFHDAFQLLPLAEVVGVECPPFVQAVGEEGLPYVEVDLVHVQAGDAHVVGAVADAQAPVGLTEEVVRLLDAVVEAEQHGAHLASVRIYFILYERVAVVVATMFIVVVVEPLVFETHLAGYGTPEFV